MKRSDHRIITELVDCIVGLGESCIIRSSIDTDAAVSDSALRNCPGVEMVCVMYLMIMFIYTR